ncbi:MAG: hypothetical protein OXU50_02155 [Gammaproteobacteria bacterium]|nr:hypothetical protein [Gammaproteobacteria bacterium]
MKTISQLPVTNEIASVIWAKKCAADKDFLAEIKADPAAKVLERPSASMQVRTVQNTTDTLHICVPDYQKMNDGSIDEISDEQMAGVAGGFFWFIPIIAGIAIAGGMAAGTAAATGAFDENTE